MLSTAFTAAAQLYILLNWLFAKLCIKVVYLPNNGSEILTTKKGLQKEGGKDSFKNCNTFCTPAFT